MYWSQFTCFDDSDGDGVNDIFPVCPDNSRDPWMFCDGEGDCKNHPEFCACAAGLAFCKTGVNPCLAFSKMAWVLRCSNACCFKYVVNRSHYSTTYNMDVQYVVKISKMVISRDGVKWLAFTPQFDCNTYALSRIRSKKKIRYWYFIGCFCI